MPGLRKSGSYFSPILRILIIALCEQENPWPLVDNSFRLPLLSLGTSGEVPTTLGSHADPDFRGRYSILRKRFLLQESLMRRLPMLTLACGILALAAIPMLTMAQDGPGGPPPREGAGPGGPEGRDGQGGGPGGPRGRGRGGFHLLPPFVMEKLDLSEEQQQQLKTLEKETKAKLEKILTPEQVKILATARPPRPGQGGPGGGRSGQGFGRRGPGGPEGGPDGGPDGGPRGGPRGGPDGGPRGGPDGGPGGDGSPRPHRPASE